MTEPRVCSIKSCPKRHIARGWCRTHYQRWRKTGDPLKTQFVTPAMSLEDRLNHHGWTVTDSGCWEWSGYITNYGYGALRTGSGAIKRAHRLAYEVWVGPIPKELPGMDYRGVVVRHKCDNRPCINPDHLESGTNRDNNRDWVERKGGSAGEKNPNARLNWAAVDKIRSSPLPRDELARKYLVKKTTIQEIQNGRTWKESRR